MMLTSTVNLLKTLSLSSGLYAEVLQTDATRTLCGLLRMLVESGANDKGKASTLAPETPAFLKVQGTRFYLLLSGAAVVLQGLTLTGWSPGSSTGAGARWGSSAASRSCPRCAALSAPPRGSACSSGLWRDTSPSTPLLCNDRWALFFLRLHPRQSSGSFRFQPPLSCCFPDPGSASAAGCLALMGQDGALSRHEVPGGEVVRLLGESPEHLLLGPSASSRSVFRCFTYVPADAL